MIQLATGDCLPQRRAIPPRRVHSRHGHTRPLHTRPLEQPPAPHLGTSLYPLRLRNQPGNLFILLPIIVRPYLGYLLEVRDERRGRGAGVDEVLLHAREVSRWDEGELVCDGLARVLSRGRRDQPSRYDKSRSARSLSNSGGGPSFCSSRVPWRGGGRPAAAAAARACPSFVTIFNGGKRVVSTCRDG